MPVKANKQLFIGIGIGILAMLILSLVLLRRDGSSKSLPAGSESHVPAFVTDSLVGKSVETALKKFPGTERTFRDSWCTEKTGCKEYEKFSQDFNGSFQRTLVELNGTIVFHEVQINLQRFSDYSVSTLSPVRDIANGDSTPPAFIFNKTSNSAPPGTFQVAVWNRDDLYADIVGYSSQPIATNKIRFSRTTWFGVGALRTAPRQCEQGWTRCV